MIAARRSFLEEGNYDPLLAEISELIQDEVSKEKASTILDSGCGEGYYTDRLARKLEKIAPQVYGTDISKYAVRIAAKRYKSVHFL